MNFKYVSYSVSIGIAVTALSLLLYKQGGALFLWPGIVMEGMINGLMLFIINSDDWYSLPLGAYLVLNTAFYSFVVSIILIITRLRFLRPHPNSNREQPLLNGKDVEGEPGSNSIGSITIESAKRGAKALTCDEPLESICEPVKPLLEFDCGPICGFDEAYQF